MADQRVVVVFGATGLQGGGVVDALLEQGNLKVRAVTRDPGSDKAKALASRGVDVVQADLEDFASLQKAFDGTYGAFLVTDFYRGAEAKPEKETAQGKAAVDAAKQAGVKHLVWSSLEDVRQFPDVKAGLKEVSPGHYVAHFESKAEVTEYLKTTGVPYTELLTSAYYDNFLGNVPFIRQDDGTYVFYQNTGSTPYAGHDVKDIGATTAVVLADPDKYLGQTVPVVAEYHTMNDAATIISKVTGKTLKFVNVPDEAAAAAGYPAAADMANMFAYYRDFPHYNNLRPLDKTAVKGKTFAEFAEAHKEALAARFK